jgi:hypothetical protein
MGRTAKTALGFILSLAGVAIGVLALFYGGVTWPVFLLVVVLLNYGGHIISHSQMREVVGNAAQLIRAWRSGPAQPPAAPSCNPDERGD